MITHSLNLLNEFIKIKKYNKDNIFKKSDFISNENLAEAQKDKTITYKDLTFPISFFVAINELTDELDSIGFYCKEVHQDNHLIITEYLVQMISDFINFVSDEVFLTIDENERIIDFFQLYLEEREIGYYPLNKGITSVSQGHFELSHQFYNQKHHVYLNAIAHRGNTIWLQINFLIEYINKNINSN
ncbi:MAG: hypothetical protein LUG60_07035 [Erysipelotrichaceae bacterium]|nr:hypothetical protein [Erysipelotrichaceae bacterium]